MAAEKTCQAFLQKKSKKEGNTKSDGVNLYLFGNRIAHWSDKGLEISNGGYTNKKGVVLSITTKDRLNKIGARVQQVKGKIYLNGSIWNGEWININEALKYKEREAKYSLFS